MYDDEKNDINNVYENESSENEFADETQTSDLEEEITSTEETEQEQTEEKDDNPLNIPDDEIWTYKVPGLAAPRIGKPIEHKLLKQILFVIVIVVAIGLSMYFSFNAVSREPFEYKTLDEGMQLKQFNNPGDVKELTIEYVCELVRNDDGSHSIVADETKIITEIREYAFNCDSYLQKVYIGKDVKQIDGKSFYYCTALYAIEVDPENQYYTSVEGVLYDKNLTEIICYPMCHDVYLRIKEGFKFSGTDKELIDINHANLKQEDFDKLSDEEKEFLRYKYYEVPGKDVAVYEEYRDKVLTYVIPSTVKKVGKLGFAYATIAQIYIPEGLKEIETLGFFRCTILEKIVSYKGDNAGVDLAAAQANMTDTYLSLPEGLERICSDAFSYDEALTYMYIPSSVKYIGHHAFWACVYGKKGDLKGISTMNVALSEEEFKNIDRGDRWLPRYDYLLFSKNIDVNYGVVRQGA